mmetsp:Transcript_12989/g.32732  ORF Transcript_12989/g.32732 Transcript_12989/m.32732 type:complete len:126 (+) Transcript_12989:268-645(+)
MKTNIKTENEKAMFLKKVHIQTETVRRTVQKHKKNNGNWKTATTVMGDNRTTKLSSLTLWLCIVFTENIMKPKTDMERVASTSEILTYAIWNTACRNANNRKVKKQAIQIHESIMKVFWTPSLTL